MDLESLNRRGKPVSTNASNFACQKDIQPHIMRTQQNDNGYEAFGSDARLEY